MISDQVLEEIIYSIDLIYQYTEGLAKKDYI